MTSTRPIAVCLLAKDLMKLCFMQDIFGHDFCCVAQCRYLHIVHGREIKNIDDTLKNKICCRGPRAAHERDHITNEIVQSRHDLAFCFYVSTVLLSVCFLEKQETSAESFTSYQSVHHTRFLHCSSPSVDLTTGQRSYCKLRACLVSNFVCRASQRQANGKRKQTRTYTRKPLTHTRMYAQDTQT